MTETRLVVALVASAVLAGAGCAKEEIKACEGETDHVEKDGRLRVQTLMTPVDVTAGGRLGGEPITGDRPMKSLLLLDYSGSMYGGYGGAPVPGCEQCKASGTRKRQPYYYEVPAFRRAIAEWLDAAGPEGTALRAQALLFNTKLWSFEGGKVSEVTRSTTLSYPWDLSSMGAGQIASELAKIPPDPFKATKRNAGATHLKEAMLLAADLLGDDGILWIITDNIADQTGAGVSSQDAARNLAFYRALNGDPRLQTVMAYPLHDDKQCTFMCGTSLFVYGIHVSGRSRNGSAEVNRMCGGHLKDGDASADGLLWNQSLKANAAKHAGKGKEPAIVGVPLRLKPMDLDVVSVGFDKDDQGRVRPIRCKRTAEFGSKIPCVASLVVKNNLRHQILERATVVFENGVMVPHKQNEKSRLKWAGAICAGDIKTYNEQLQEQSKFPISNLAPGAEEKINVVMVLPAVTIAPSGLELVDTAFTDSVILTGGLTARIEDVRTRLYVAKEQSREVYGAASLPGIFRSHDQSEVRVQFTASVPVQNDGKLTALLVIGGLLLLLLLIIFFVMRFQRVTVTAYIDGIEVERMSLPRISSRKLEKTGQRIGKAKRGWSRAVSFKPARGFKSKKQGAAWIVEPPAGSEMRVELKKGWSSRGGGSSKKGTPGGF